MFSSVSETNILVSCGGMCESPQTTTERESLSFYSHASASVSAELSSKPVAPADVVDDRFDYVTKYKLW